MDRAVNAKLCEVQQNVAQNCFCEQWNINSTVSHDPPPPPCARCSPFPTYTTPPPTTQIQERSNKSLPNSNNNCQ